MRLKWILLGALLCLQAVAASVSVDDPVGDVTVYANGSTGQPDPSGVSAAFDLTFVEVLEFDHEILLAVETVEARGERPVLLTVHLTFGGEPYLLRIDDLDATQQAFLENAAIHGSPVPVPLTIDGARRQVVVEKTLLVASDASAGTIGTDLVIERVIADSGSLARGGDERTFYTQDLIEGPATLIFELGAQPWTDIRLSSPAPFRGSNGGGGVFVYDVVVSEMVGEEQVVALNTAKVPADWQVEFPLEVIHLEPDEARTIPVVVTMPSGHQHGAIESVLVQGTRLGESTILGEIELGVRFTTIPQPAGHHPKLWLHSRATSSITGAGFFNALEDDTRDEHIAINNDRCVNVGAQNEYTWTIPLDPRLNIGLDFKLDAVSTLHLPFSTDVPITDIELEMMLVADSTVLASMNKTPIPDLEPGTTPVDVELAIAPAADYLPFEANRELFLRIIMLATDPYTRACALTGVTILPGGEMILPLTEYRDRLSETASGALSAAEVPAVVAPGSRLVVEHAVSGQPGTQFSIRVYGSGMEHAELSHAQVQIPEGDTEASFSLIIDVPPEAPDGQNIDIVVEAAGANVFGLARTAFVIGATGAAVVDDLPEGSETQQSPGLGGVLLVLALAGAARRRR